MNTNKINYTNDYRAKAELYSEQGITGTLTIGYKILPELFSRYTPANSKALDFGCGTGRSTKFLQKCGYITDGVDIDPNVIRYCKNVDNSHNYKLIANDKIPQRDLYYDLVFSSLVFLEIPSFDQIKKSFQEIYRVMKFGGTCIILTVSNDFYKYDWLSIDTDYSENNELFSGKKLRIRLKELNLELFDYYWTSEDYQKAAKETGFTVLEIVLPTAKKEDVSNEWISEKNISSLHDFCF